MAEPSESERDFAASGEEQQGLLQPSSDTPPAMGSDVTKPEGRKGDTLASAVVWVSIAVFILTTWAVVLSSDPASLGWFKYHPLLQSAAIGCFTYGVLTLQPTSQPHSKAAGLQRHQIATIGLGVPLILLGSVAILLHKNGHAHFTTWHGTFGIITVAWIATQALVGGSTVWFDGVIWGGGLKAKAMWKYHRLSGYILYPVLLFTAHLAGNWSYWVTRHSESLVRSLAYSIAPVFILVAVFSRVRPSKMKFF